MTSVPASAPSSPVCYASQADDRYMGFAEREEIIVALGGLLEAERAGVRVGARLVSMADRPDRLALARNIRADESRCCKMLVAALRRLDAKPSTRVGDFYDKIMATESFDACLVLLNRGQGWVVRKLESLLPKVRDDQLHADLRAMLEVHVANIESTERALTLSIDGRKPMEPSRPPGEPS